MINEVFRSVFLKVHISKCYSQLQSINDLYLKGDNDEYLQKMELFFLDLPSQLPDNTVKTVYSDHNELFTQIDHCIKSRNTSALYNLYPGISLFFENLYDMASYSQRTRKRGKYAFSGLIIVALISLSVIFYPPLKAKYISDKRQYDLLASEETFKKQTLDDIFVLKEAIQRYFNDNKSYPKSSGGWDAVIAAFGQSTKDWIPGLVPKYIKELPTDPRKSKDPMMQYMYKSDGTDFKLIAHFPVGMSEIINNHPELVDSIRPSWSFGVWSNGAKGW